MEIKPDKKLITKSWLTLISVTICFIIFVLILHIIPLLDSDIELSRFSVIIWKIAAAIILIMWIFTIPIMILWIKNLTFMIDHDKVIIHKGIITKIQQNIPFRMITDFKLERTLYDRWLKIGSIKIQTAGQTQNSTGYEGKLSGLADWNSLHDLLRKNLRTIYSGSDNLLKGTKQTGNNGGEILQQILTELKLIRSNLEKK